ncbi:MAG TPA: amino acid permease [Candidatus Acidoferrales bacterium]
MPDSANTPPAAPGPAAQQMVRSLGAFHATMVVMGGIVGSGIFMNPYVVAQHVHTPLLILGVWALGGLVALGGAFVYAELAARRPLVGGQYAYIREAYHPALGFLYGWVLLLVIQTGGMAAVAVTFARYFTDLTGIAAPDWLLAVAALGALTIINCLGVQAGSMVQSTLMVMKIAAIVALVACGWLLAGEAAPREMAAAARGPVSLDLLTAVGVALVPVLFSYGGWQTANFIAGEVRDPRKTLPRALLWGVAGVIALYLAVNFVCVRVLGAEGLAASVTPASDVMRAALGEAGAKFIAAGIAISALGFLSQSMLTAPRVYFAMADDGLFFRGVARLHPRTRVPVVAIALQGACAMIIAVSGRYEQILNYVVSMDFIFFGLTATTIFVMRRRDASISAQGGEGQGAFRIPGHPWTTLLFIAACWGVALNTILRYPANTLIGVAILLAGVPAFYYWRARQPKAAS